MLTTEIQTDHTPDPLLSEPSGVNLAGFVTIFAIAGVLLAVGLLLRRARHRTRRINALLSFAVGLAILAGTLLALPMV